jgi:diguanylate cyclase (GGDEF)-like protein
VAYAFQEISGALEVLLMFLAGVLVALLAARSVVLVGAYRQLVMREATLRESTAAMLDSDTDADLDGEFSLATRVLLPDDDVTWSWRRSTEDAIRADSGAVTLNQAPAQLPNEPFVTYRYGYTIGGEELNVELATRLLLDPLDWAGVQALAETAVQSRSRHRLREEREEAAEAARMSAMLAGAQDMVVLLDDQHVIRHALGAVGELTGQDPDYWIGRSVSEVFDDPHQVIAVAVDSNTRRRRIMARLRNSSAQVEATVVRSDSSEVSVSLHDVTTRMKLTRELQHRAHHDVLTGLPNRSYLELMLAEHGIHWRSEGVPFSVVYLDIDDFKVVNDSLGHRLGDALLVGLARLFTSAVGERGAVARLGGDEFAVLLPGLDLPHALLLADELVNDVLSEPLTIEGVEIQVRVSAGVAAADDRTSEEGEQVLQAADLALYDARAKGKAQVAPFREELRDRAARKLHDANAVTSAAREQAFRFDYQPIVNIAEHSVVAMEALMRWDRGEELQRPDAFIPIAESLGELTRMLRDVLPSALAELKGWRRTYPKLRLAVNVHAGALQDHEFVDWFTDTVQGADLPLESVIVEVSERTLVPSGADRNLARLRQRDVPIWIDDFGTGWSNLSSLERLPVTGVKLARELVVDDVGGVKSDLVSAVLQLAEAVGFVVTAEGVETTEQVERLSDLGVSVVQGYLVGRPMNAADALTWLRRYSSTAESV